MSHQTKSTLVLGFMGGENPSFWALFIVHYRKKANVGLKII